MKASLRRLKLEDLLSKIAQIDEQAALTLAEYPNGHTIERQRLIIAIARQIRSHLQDQMRQGEREEFQHVPERPRVAVLTGD
jgi:hypothetical protein